jgi:hypothetical protein
MSKRLKTKEEIELWLSQMKIEKYTINEDLTVDVHGCVDISNQQLTTIPIQFGRVDGHFFCYSNKLTSLKGSPKYVGDIFACEDNKLTSLLGGPEEVGGDYGCHYNQLTNLNHLAKIIGGEVDCSHNPLDANVVIPKSSMNQLVNDMNVDETSEQIENRIENTDFQKPKSKLKA